MADAHACATTSARPAFGPASHARDLRGRARAVRVGRRAAASTCSCSPSTTASTTAGCPRRSRWPASMLGDTSGIVIDIAAVARCRCTTRCASPSRSRCSTTPAPGGCERRAASGYRADEFEMAGVDHASAGASSLEEYVDVMRKAWTGEPFEWQGRTIVVTPKPMTQPASAPDDARRRGRSPRGRAARLRAAASRCCR